MTSLAALASRIDPLDERAMAEASARLDRLTKPPGSLGRLEELARQLAGITGRPSPQMGHPAAVVFAADHGVARHAVSAYPSDVTAQMVANIVAGGAAINAISRLVGARVVVVDVGVAGPIPPSPIDASRPGAELIDARIARGTRDMTIGPAMTQREALAAVEVGLATTARLIEDGVDLIAVGEMGIGNTTAASAVTALLTHRPPADVTGPGTGLDEAAVRNKVGVIEAALARNNPDPTDPIAVLKAVGGLEIAALVGAMLAAAGARVPVILDGFITGSAALVATQIAPRLTPRLIASHRSMEPGHRVILDHLGLDPLFELQMRLGEGTGAALAVPILRAATAILAEMATFEGAGVSGPRRDRKIARHDAQAKPSAGEVPLG